jgi:hypothetical protein
MQEMSLPWIKIECGLINKPEVMQLAGLLDIDEHTVVGHLVAFWSWVDANMSRDCPDTTGTKRGLDRVAGRDGFTDALVQVGWLEFDGSRVTVPHFDYHLSQSAKTRATDARKKARQRAASRSKGDNVPLQSGQEGGPEEIRRDKKYIYVQSPDVLIPTTMDNDTCKDAMVRWCKYLEAKGWHESAPSENDMQLQAAWNMAARIGPDQYPGAVEYSIANGWKNLRVPNEGTAGAKKRKPHNQKAWQMVVAICLQHASTTPEDSKLRQQKLGDNFEAFRQVGGFGRYKAANDMQRQAMAAEFIAILEARDGEQVTK